MSKSTGADYPPKKMLDYEIQKKQIEFRELLAQKIGSCVFVMSFGVPLWFVYGMVSSIAGKETNFNINVVWSVVVSGTGFALISTWIRAQSQSKELKRLRPRIKDLEEKLQLKILSSSND
ncbi:MAG: hypothetical protein JKX85_11565 [Phycisphaeraceae bacterium]|nr:hypothetical protein [Phycisphaeraceae bacterium]